MNRSIAKFSLLLAFGPAVVATVDAATLGDIAAALAAPSAASQATNDWAAFAKLKQVQWKGNAPKQGGQKFYWNGALPIDGIGPGELSLVGTKYAVISATAWVAKKVELSKIQQVVTTQFPKDAKIEQVRGACPEERMSGSRIYRVTLGGRKPLYVHAQSVTEDRGGSYTTFELEPQRNKGWIC